MAYANLAQIEIAAGGNARLVELADFDADGAADAAVIAAAQASVDGVIDSYCLRYATPLANPSDTLRELAAAEVVYRLHEQRGNVQQDSPMHRAHLERVAWLDKVSRGLVVPSSPLPAPSSQMRSAWVEREGITRDSLKGGPW